MSPHVPKLPGVRMLLYNVAPQHPRQRQWSDVEVVLLFHLRLVSHVSEMPSLRKTQHLAQTSERFMLCASRAATRSLRASAVGRNRLEPKSTAHTSTKLLGGDFRAKKTLSKTATASAWLI